MSSTHLHLFADIGGTFSDCLFWEPPEKGASGRGRFSVKKLLSTGIIPVQVRKTISSKSLEVINFPWKTHRSLLGYSLVVRDQHGRSFRTVVTDTDTLPDTLQLADSLPTDLPDTFTAQMSFGSSVIITAVRMYLGLTKDAPLPPVNIRYATTVGTNALLERKGRPTALLTTQGFEDILKIGYQDRPDLFKLNIIKPDPLTQTVFGVSERVDASGQIKEPLDHQKTLKYLINLKRNNIDSIAVSLLNSWVNPDHELAIAELAENAGFRHITLSHQSSPLIKLIPRTDTAMTDAYLTPLLTDHFRCIQNALHPDSTLRIMTSAGGLTTHDQFTGKHSILSGPAGGIVALSKIFSQTHFSGLIGFDMGGTSTDVSRFDGSFDYRADTEVAGVRLTTPMLNIETVAAGGGSICLFDGTRLRVGPESAGAQPGPAAYDNNGPLTLTDVNIQLGYLPRFPFTLNLNAVKTRLQAIQSHVENQTGKQISLTALAAGFRKIACETMAASIRKISLARGYDIRTHALCCFGGAGPQHACQLADLLGMNRVIIHPLASVLSAYGLSVAPAKVILEKPIMEILRTRYLYTWEDTLKELRANANEMLAQQGADPTMASVRTMADIRYMGQSHTLTIDFDGLDELESKFRAAHLQHFGHVFDGRGIEVTALRLELSGEMPSPELPLFAPAKNDLVPLKHASIYLQDRFCQVPVYRREDLKPHHRFSGPALVAGPDTSILVEADWTGTVDRHLMLTLSRTPAMELPETRDAQSDREHQDATTQATRQPNDPVFQEVVHHRLASIAEEMGVVLQKSAVSTNIRERMDFSCAVFSADGYLTANAPHIPVHLGAMGETVRAVCRTFQTLSPGDVIVTNDPYQGGSHLPDVTVIIPVFHESETPCYFTAVRAHHAEIGGISPGSMPPTATHLHQEGVVISPVNIARNGQLDLDILRNLLTAAQYPSRSPEDNISDILAQIAACRRGVKLLTQLTIDHGFQRINQTMTAIRKSSADAMRTALAKRQPGTCSFTDHLDNGTPISVTITITETGATVDFTGTGPVLKGNLNANPAIVRSAVMYCFRSMIDTDVPLNEGVLDPVTITVPPSLLNPPCHADISHRAAVSGGNVETSQRICDVVLGALGIAAAGQGTMNNVTLGNRHFSYYETIGGGAGAGADFDGAHGVQVNMTNTRITDPEVIERRYGVEVMTFALRTGSGGTGCHHGGDGLIRQYRFSDPLEISILSERRGPNRPFGLNGGSAGASGSNQLIDRNGQKQELPGKITLTVEAGQQLRIETPGGGAFGENQ